jgi:RHS repeat-associated protein
LQSGINSLGSAGATGGYSSLLSAASSLAYSLFAATNYELNSGRSDTQFVADLYYTYLQRGPDDGGLGWWAGQVPGNGRYNVLLAFQYSGEFQTLVSTLYGTATSDNQRTEHIVNNFYLGALGRDANSSELATERDALNNAAAQGLTQVQSELENFARSIFASQIYDYSMSDQQFVTNLYEGFLQRGPDAGGLGFWTSIAANGNRQNVLNAFVGATEFRELAATLYREEFWLVRDRVGSPRMIVDKSGSLASVKRHDYLPFGEELTVGQARTPAVGFTGDDTRQKFTGYEHDSETGLNFAEARYQSSSQGRFTSIDPLMASAQVTSPQSFNRYSHALNNPLRFVDSSGMAAEEHDNEISAAFAELNSLADWADDVRQAQADKAKEDARKQQQQQQAPAQQTNQQNNQQGNAPRTPTKYDVTKDKAIGKQLDQIRAKAKPLASGQTPVLSDVKVVEGDTVDLNGQTLVDPYGQETQDPVFGTIKPIAYVPLDQGGNIIPDGSGIGIQEVISRNGSAPERIPADRLAPAPPGGVFFDMQFIATGQPTATVKQTVFVVQLSRSGGIASAFSIGQNSITLNAPMPGKTGSVSATIASPKRMQQ